MTTPQGSGPRRHDRGETCPDCGHIHPACLGHAKHTNDERRAAAIARWGNGPDGPWPCGGQPLRGLEVCRKHGSAPAHARTAAADRITRATALGEVGALLGDATAQLRGRPLVDALQDALDRAGAMVAVLGLLVAELDLDTDWHWHDVPGANGGIQRFVELDSTAGLVGPNARGEQKPNALVVLYGEWTDRLARISKAAADLGLEERRIALDETKAQAVVAAVLAALRDTGADTPEVRTAIATRLRALESG